MNCLAPRLLPLWIACLLFFFGGASLPAQDEPDAQPTPDDVADDVSETPAYLTPRLLAEGLQNPESAALGPDGRVYVSVIGEFDKDDDGGVAVLTDEGVQMFVEGLDDPKGLIAFGDHLYVTDKTRVVRIDSHGKATVLAAAKAFPQPPKFLNDIAVDSRGYLYVSDSGDLQGAGGAIFRISPKGKVTLVTSTETQPKIQGPNGLFVEDDENLLVLDFYSGELSRLNLKDNTLTRLVTDHKGGDGLLRDANGKFYVTQWTTGRVYVLASESRAPTLLPGTYLAAADCCFSADGSELIVPDMTAGTLTAILLTGNPAVELNEAPLPVEIERAFGNLEFNRPIVLTHAGDGSNRVFVASQLGQVFVFPNEQEVSAASVFLDLEPKVSYKDNENEEGFLGMAFHPQYAENGQLFIYYTTKDAPHTSVVSRFTVSADDPNHVDPATEVELLRIPQPFWNHNGGTLAFGPDGYLYIALGDGGKANDPFGHGQNLKTWLGAILRIDVDNPSEGQAYGIPADNPFVNYPGAQPEIWAYGVRNPWRISFDRATGECWVADVGQDLWEEVSIARTGDNLGWNLREGMHPFGIGGVQQPRADLVDPIFEYHHDVGKSITGGHVYRGERVQALVGAYVYADYVTGAVSAIRYDAARGVLTDHRAIPGNISPVLSFGEDEPGDVYFLTVNGQVFRFRDAEAAAAE